MKYFQMSDSDDIFDQSEEAEKRDFDRQFEQYSNRFVKAGFREAFEDEKANEEILRIITEVRLH